MRRFFNRPAAAGSAVLLILKVVWHCVDAWSNVEFVAEKLQPLIRAPVLSWVGDVPAWFIAAIATYAVAWLAWGRPGRRPRLVLEATDDGRPVEPRESHLFLENTGDADAFNVQVSRITFPKWIIQPKLINRIPAKGQAEVRCDLRRKERPKADDYDKPLADSLSWAFRALDVLAGERQEHMSEGSLLENVRVVYSDQDGRRFSGWFTVSFAWALEKFDPVRLYRPSLRERLRTR